jgi:anti-sigma regulatory factor (Ser/Thr protein kinase)
MRRGQMDIKKTILKRLQNQGRLTVADMVKATGFSRVYIHRFFQELKDEGKIQLIGRANLAHYILANLAAIDKSRKSIQEIHYILKNNNLQEDQVLEQVRKNTGILVNIQKNVSDVFNYAFTEMLNNAIEHSLSDRIDIKVERLGDSIHFTIGDRGIGIFRNIMSQKRLATSLEAIGDLIKGKQTTAPQAHSGEGIFFTSKVADRLMIKSDTKKLIFDNFIEDVVVADCAAVVGTKVFFSISLTSHRQLEDVFRSFSNDAFEFSKTQILVRLFQIGHEYVSRSQARRILVGLDAFETIVLDFAGINGVGQAFADEVFRVWQKRFPQKNIIVRNSNENIDFMIQRAKGNS